MRIRIFLLLAFSAILSAGYSAAESARITPTVKIVKEWSPAVVNISTERVLLLGMHPFWGQFRGTIIEFNDQSAQMVGTMKLKSVGSGVVVSQRGLILTNAHVVQQASRIYVVLSDGKHAEAVIEKISPEDDLALIKIDPPEELKSAKIADDAMIGETVIAIGNPLGLENSVSSGVVSGLNRDIGSGAGFANTVLTGLIQTDASINPGSSGGALFNLDGQLVGVNIAVVQGANSIGFAIPYNKIKKMLSKKDESGDKAEEGAFRRKCDQDTGGINIFREPYNMSGFFIERRIYYHDTDCGGVVYYANYLKHFEEARTEYLRSAGIDVAEYAAKGNLFAVVHMEIDYKCPARYGDIVRVSAGIETVGNASIHFAQEVKRGDTLLVRARIVLACIDNNMKARRVPEELKEKFTADEK